MPGPADNVRIVPLFPLSTVLFPGITLPLHIFEERYKTMLRECLAGDQRFGVVLIREGWEVGSPATPHEVGTLARIVRTDALDEGRMNVLTVGEQRFRIRELVEGRPYLRGRVELLDDESTEVEPRLAARVREDFGSYLQALRRLANRAEVTIELPTSPRDLSYVVAATLQIPLVERQVLLEAPVSADLQVDGRPG
jgi:uncharacterized protein